MQALRDGLCLCKHSEEVLSSQFPQITVRPPPSRQLGEQGRICRYVFEAQDYFRDSVKIAADPDMIDARDFADVFDLIRNLR